MQQSVRWWTLAGSPVHWITPWSSTTAPQQAKKIAIVPFGVALALATCDARTFVRPEVRRKEATAPASMAGAVEPLAGADKTTAR